MTASAAAGCGAVKRPALWSWLASAAAAAAAVLLWGVGSEAVYFGHRLSGGFLLADAAIVTLLEAATVASSAIGGGGGASVVRGGCLCGQLERLATAVDTYKRAIVYALLTAPCFVQLHRYWLPAVPGGVLVLSSVLYAVKHCCTRKIPYDFGKMPTFVRFEEDCYLTPDLLPPAAVTQNIYQPAWPVTIDLGGDPPADPRHHRPQATPSKGKDDDRLRLIGDEAGIGIS